MSQQKVGGVKIRLKAASNELLLSNGGDETKHRLRLETTEWRQLAPNVEIHTQNFLQKLEVKRIPIKQL